MRVPLPDGEVRAPWQPAVSTWGHLWRLALVALVSALVWLPAETAWPPAYVVVDVGLGLLALALTLLRRRLPLAVAVVTTLLGAVSGTAAGPAVLASVSLATHRRYGQVLLVGALGVLTAQFWTQVMAPSPEPVWVTLPLNAAVIAATLVLGLYVGSRRELLWTLRERAERAEAEQALRVAQARTTERQRIAREMHDVLGHRISLVGMHAGALAYRHDLDRVQVAESARVIEDNARLAMSELRSVLGVLRTGDGQEPEDHPAPTLGDLGALVDEANASGMRVQLHQDVRDARTLPDGTGRTAYRIVQEGLTNVRKHAPAALATVRVTGSPADGLRVRVDNPLPAGVQRVLPGAGYGIVGLSERAELAGGQLRARVADDCWVLEVDLPWET